MTDQSAEYRAAIEALPRDPRDLIPPEERQQLQADLIEMARKRRQVEAESGWIPLAHNDCSRAPSESDIS